MHKCKYIHTYIHIYMHAYIYTYIPTYRHTYIHRQANRFLGIRAKTLQLVYQFLGSTGLKPICFLNRNRKLEISTAPTKAKSREPAYSHALVQNKIGRQRVKSKESDKQSDGGWYLELRLGEVGEKDESG